MKTKNAQHTKGPWEVVYNDAYVITHPTGDRTYRYVATTDSQADSSKPIQLEDKQEDESNARLIAAAPDLLSACREALDYLGRIDEGSEGCELRDSLRAAIAKAEAQP